MNVILKLNCYMEMWKKIIPKSVAKSAKPCIALFSIRANKEKSIKI